MNTLQKTLAALALFFAVEPLAAEDAQANAKNNPPKTEADRQHSLAQARSTYEAEQQRLQIAVAKLGEPALERCLQMGRLTAWLDAVDAERTQRNEELARLQKLPGSEAFTLAIECRTRLQKLEEARRRILVELTRLEQEHLSELVREGRVKPRLAPSTVLPHLPRDLQ